MTEECASGGASHATLLETLSRIVADEDLLTSLSERTFFVTDVARPGETAAAVVRIRNAAQLSKVVRACTDLGHVVIPRGGGFSYTGGYTPDAPGAVVIDMRLMDRIVEINTEDMYVVVEPGCTWQRLYDALKAKGMRTPYFGPMSGYRATVGGALSQGSFFLGSTQHGTTAETVLGLEVVLADGTIVKTGSGASIDDVPPYFRQYGPDATGLFLNDTGAMGFKTQAVLKLIPFPDYQSYGTFAFAGADQAARAVSAIGRSAIVAECYCWDPYFVQLMAAASTGAKEDLRFLLNVVKAGSGLADGIGAALRIALAGKRVFSGDTFLLHVVIDDATREGAAAKLKRIRKIARAAGGTETSPSAPRALRGTPFTDFNVPERRSVLRNLPTNSLSPHSRAPAVAAACYAYLAEHEAEMARLGIKCGIIFFAVGAQAMCIEPLLYWEDEQHFLHNRIDESSDLVGLAQFTGRPEATEYAFRMREGFKTIFREHGCLHVQIGRSYPWLETRQPNTAALMTSIKNLLDPRRLMNRGSLGFGDAEA